MTLENLCDELGTMKWVDADEGWDLAIEAVRKRIRECIAVPENAFGLSDEDIQKLREEFSKPSMIINKPVPSTESMWEKCEVCGREKKYTSAIRMHCKYDCESTAAKFQPCLLDNVPSGTITNVACSCPKCSQSAKGDT